MTHVPVDTGSTVLDEVAEVLGEEATFALAEEFMGERTYIPKSHVGERRIVEAIGEEQARRLCDVFYGTLISFPVKLVIERRVLEMDRQGLTRKETARRLKIRERRVYDILRRHRERG